MRRIVLSLAAVLTASVVFAQTDAERYRQRYELLVSKVGAAGIGVETVLNNWEKLDSTDAGMLMGKFSYFFTKSQKQVVVTRPGKKYLGMEPLLTLKDSLGNDVYYYQDNEYDDELYAQALKVADRAVSLYPDRLDWRFLKANAYIAYEKESPDMALASLQSLIRENSRRKSAWIYDDAEVEEDFFENAMQEYCFSFYTIGSPASYEAFKTLSEQLREVYPSNSIFMSNVGSYYMVNEEYKTALKYYDKVLKKQPDDYTALQNALLASRKLKSVKLEKKYLSMIVRHGSEKDRLVAKGRLDYLKRK